MLQNPLILIVCPIVIIYTSSSRVFFQIHYFHFPMQKYFLVVEHISLHCWLFLNFWTVAPDSNTSNMATGSELAMAHGISKGDLIKVTEGELSSLEGRVIRIDGDKITMQPYHKDLKVGRGHGGGAMLLGGGGGGGAIVTRGGRSYGTRGGGRAIVTRGGGAMVLGGGGGGGGAMVLAGGGAMLLAGGGGGRSYGTRGGRSYSYSRGEELVYSRGEELVYSQGEELWYSRREELWYSRGEEL